MIVTKGLGSTGGLLVTQGYGSSGLVALLIDVLSELTVSEYQNLDIPLLIDTLSEVTTDEQILSNLPLILSFLDTVTIAELAQAYPLYIFEHDIPRGSDVNARTQTLEKDAHEDLSVKMEAEIRTVLSEIVSRTVISDVNIKLVSKETNARDFEEETDG